jgi:hypothetical protein
VVLKKRKRSPNEAETTTVAAAIDRVREANEVSRTEIEANVMIAQQRATVVINLRLMSVIARVKKPNAENVVREADVAVGAIEITRRRILLHQAMTTQPRKIGERTALLNAVATMRRGDDGLALVAATAKRKLAAIKRQQKKT